MFPSTLTHLSVGDNYDQPINNCQFPPFLQYLSFGEQFNHPVENSNLATIKSLTNFLVGENFDQSIEKLENLTHLSVGAKFLYPVTQLKLTNLKILSEKIAQNQLPPSLTHLTCVCTNDQTVTLIRALPNLTTIRLDFGM